MVLVVGGGLGGCVAGGCGNLRFVIEQIEASAWLTLLVWGLAAYRLTRLVVLEEVLGSPPAVDPRSGGLVPGDRGDGVRRWVDVALYDDAGDARNGLARWVGRWYSCTYCVGTWMSALWVVGWVNGGDPIKWVLVVAAVAGFQGYANSRPGA